MSKLKDFRRRNRPGWSRPDAAEKMVPIKRLRGLEEFVKPAFVGRMDRVRRRRRLTFIAMLISAALTGAAIGWSIV